MLKQERCSEANAGKSEFKCCCGRVKKYDPSSEDKTIYCPHCKQFHEKDDANCWTHMREEQ